MIRRPPRSTRTDTLFPYTTLFRSPILIFDAVTSELVEVDFRGTANDLAERLAGKPADRNEPVEARGPGRPKLGVVGRSEEHTSELQSLMRISYAVFCLKKKNTTKYIETNYTKTEYDNT